MEVEAKEPTIAAKICLEIGFLRELSREMFEAIDSEQYISAETCELINQFECELEKHFQNMGLGNV